MGDVPLPRRSLGRGQSVNLAFWEDRPGRAPGASYARRDPVSNNFKLHVRSIPLNWNVTILRNVFSKCGEPKSVYMHPPKGALTWGFVEYEHYLEAATAVQQLNNNVLLNIQVMFAREKLESDNDPVLQFLTSQTQEDEDMMDHQYTDPVVDPKLLTKTVKNDTPLRTEIPMDNYRLSPVDPATQKCVEDYLFDKIIEMYKKGEGSTSKCNTCDASCSMACSGCLTVFYCSENCQNRDWESHSKNCKGASAGTVEDTMPQSRDGGDHRHTKNESTNGYGSFGGERENKFDYRSNRYSGDRRNRDGDRGNLRDNDKGYNRDRGGQRVDQSGNDQQGKRSLFEERKAKMSSSFRQKESDSGFQSRFAHNNQQPSTSHETRNTFKPVTKVADEDWGSQNKDSDAKESSTSTPGLDFIDKEKAFLQTIEPSKQESSTVTAAEPQEIKNISKESSVPEPSAKVLTGNSIAEEEVLQPGSVLEVCIVSAEDRGLFWVHKTNESEKFPRLSQKLKECLETSSSQFNPVQDGICGIKYEEEWYRCQITSLNPITVRYIDFGYPETVEASRLFELPSELISLSPLVLKIKLVDGTSDLYLDKIEPATLAVKLVKKEVNYWLAHVVGDKLTLPEVQEAVTQVETPLTVTTSAPNASTSVALKQIDQEKTSQQETMSAQNASPQPPVQEQPFPSMFSVTDFTTVSITYSGDKDQNDTYYVGTSTIWNTVAEMCSHFQSIIEKMEQLPLKNGTLGLAQFLGDWYRVKVVSVNPPIVHYIDFGNIEPLDPEGLRSCPVTHRDIPHLVHKIKLAPGTSEKYFKLPDGSEIRVKPDSWLFDGTVMVKVEGEDYTEIPTIIQAHENTSSTDTTLGSTTPTAPAPTADTTSDPSAACSATPPQANSTPSDPADSSADPVDIVSSKFQSTVNMLQEKWRILFIPNKVDFVKNSLLGQVCCENLPSAFSFMMDNENYQNYLNSQEFDPNFRPNVKEVVGLRTPSGEWERVRELPQPGLVAFYDICGVTRSSQLFKLPESFADVPSMAAVLTLRKEDPNLLSCLVEKDEIIFHVTKVINNKGHTVVHVSNNDLQEIFEGELKTWEYEPLETPDPLAPGAFVTISRVIDSNTLLVSPTDDLEIQQSIQIYCRKSCEEFKTTPKEGDYVAFLDKESDGYFRCRIDKVDGDAYTVYCVDDAIYHQAKLGDLRPLPGSLRNIPCRITQIELKDVDKVVTTEQAQMYLSLIVEEDKSLAVDTDISGKSTLTVEGEKDTLNNKLKEFLKPQIVPTEEGKLTIMSLPELRVPLNKEFGMVVCQTEPLYVQLMPQTFEYYDTLHVDLQKHCAEDNAPYNPCVGELCLALFDGEWYRCRCLKETNTGVSVLMLVDYGNIFNSKTSDIRRIVPELLTTPSIATSCKIHDLPDPVSPALKARLEEILVVNKPLYGIFVAENDGCYEVVIDSVKQAIQELK